MDNFVEIDDGDFIVEAKKALTRNVGQQINPKYLIVYCLTAGVTDLVDRFTTNEDVKESTHLIIDDRGGIVQLAPFVLKTWHAGASYWQGHHGLNGFAIGIHVASQYGSVTSEQQETLHRVIPALVQHYNLRDIVEHRRPGGQPVDISDYKQYVEYGNADSVGRFVAIADIIIRGGPDVRFEGMDQLNAGDAVKVLRYSDDKQWVFVLYERKDHQPRLGWTHESFVKRL